MSRCQVLEKNCGERSGIMGVEQCFFVPETMTHVEADGKPNTWLHCEESGETTNLLF